MLKDADCRFTFKFPDGQTLSAVNDIGPAGAVANGAIADKLTELCGGAKRPRQVDSLYLALTRFGPRRHMENAFRQHGIASDKYLPATFTLSANNDTGDVTVVCTEPKDFPVKFRWMATVAVDGTVTATPLVIRRNLSPRGMQSGAPPALRLSIRIPPAFPCPRSGFHGFQCRHPSRHDPPAGRTANLSLVTRHFSLRPQGAPPPSPPRLRVSA